jgi:hypothetical protein
VTEQSTSGRQAKQHGVNDTAVHLLRILGEPDSVEFKAHRAVNRAPDLLGHVDTGARVEDVRGLKIHMLKFCHLG